MKQMRVALVAAAIFVLTLVVACGGRAELTPATAPSATPQVTLPPGASAATPITTLPSTVTATPIRTLPPSVMGITSPATLPPGVTGATAIPLIIIDEPAFDEVTLMARALSQCTDINVTDTQSLLRVAESDLSDDLVACINNHVTSLASSLPAPATPAATSVATSRPVETATPSPRPASTPVPVDIVAEPAFDAVTLTARAVSDCTGIDVTDTASLLQAATSELTDELVACINEFLAKETGQ